MTRTLVLAALVLVGRPAVSGGQAAIIVDPHVIGADRIVGVLRDAMAQLPADEGITGPIVVVRREDAGRQPHMPAAWRLALEQELARLGREAVIFTWGAKDRTIYVLADSVAVEQHDLVRLAAALVGAQHRVKGQSPRAAAAARLRVYRALNGDEEDYVQLAEHSDGR